MKSELEIATILSDKVSDVAQPSTSSGVGKHNTKSNSEKMKPAKGEKKKEKSKKKSKHFRKKFQTSSSSPESSSSSSSTADEDEKRSSRAFKSKAKKKFFAVDGIDHESSEFEKDVLQTSDDL